MNYCCKFTKLVMVTLHLPPPPDIPPITAHLSVPCMNTRIKTGVPMFEESVICDNHESSQLVCDIPLPLPFPPPPLSLPSRFGRGLESVETASSLMSSQNNQYAPRFQSSPPLPLQLTTYNPPGPPAYNAPAYINPPPFAEALKHRTRPPSGPIQTEIPGTVHLLMW